MYFFKRSIDNNSDNSSSNSMLRSLSFSIWHRLRNETKRIPGVIYSNEIDLEAEHAKWNDTTVGNWLPQNIRRDNIPKEYLTSILEDEASELDNLDKSPYTFRERVGIVRVPLSRVRPRQYYYPITDFALYNYDERSPEEEELLAKWTSRIFAFNFTMPIIATSFIWCLSSVFGQQFQASMLVVGGVSTICLEIWRTYSAALIERQNLDDFILAKEIWYMKNVETYQLNIPRIPRGREKEFQELVDFRSNKLIDKVPSELSDLAHV